MAISEPADEMYRNDPSAAALGIEVLEASDDGAVVRMTIRDDMCNGLGMIHGGMLFLLADSAMAFASNAGPASAVATTAEIDWLAPARAGQVITATSTRRWAGRRSALWDVTITVDDDGDHRDVAMFRGRTRIIS